MISVKVLNLAKQSPTAEVLIDSRRRWRYSDLATAASSVAGSLRDLPGAKIGVWCNEVPTLIATLLATDALGLQSVLFSAGTNAKQVANAVANLHLERVLTDDRILVDENAVFQTVGIDESNSSQALPSVGPKSSQVILFTSGTSGAPKPAVHTWESLAAGVTRDSKYAGRKWLLAYDPTSFAGIQVWLQALLTGGCVCVPQSGDFSATVQFLIQQRVEFASATPTFWRLLLHSGSPTEFARTSLVQITLGGEAVDQSLLDALRQAFPHARVTHIYASTEMGSCFAVHDGRAGFPADFVDNENRPCRLRVSDAGELEICSRRSMIGYLENSLGSADTSASPIANSSNWFATGDLVERRGDRFYFIGRKSETINIGGAKVYPLRVEECIRAVEGVETVRVYGIASSLIGQLVCAEVQAGPSFDQEALRRSILAACRSRLTRQQVPALIKFNEQLAINGNTKLLRTEVVHGS